MTIRQILCINVKARNDKIMILLWVQVTLYHLYRHITITMWKPTDYLIYLSFILSKIYILSSLSLKLLLGNRRYVELVMTTSFLQVLSILFSYTSGVKDKNTAKQNHPTNNAGNVSVMIEKF